MKFPEVSLAVGDGLEEGYRYVLERFEQQGFNPQTLEEITVQLPCREQVRLFTLNGSNCLYLFTVVTDPWQEALVVDVLNSLLSLRQATQGPRLVFQFFTAHPLPPALAYIFEDSFRGALECDALLEIRFDFEETVDLDRPTYLARQCQRWIQDHFHRTLYPTQLETLNWINQLVLEQLRAPYLPDQLLSEHTYEPINSLFALGCFVGEVLISHPQLYGRWVHSEQVGGLALQVCPRLNPPRNRWFSWRERPAPAPAPTWAEGLVLNPIGKVVKLFQEGAQEDLPLFAEVVLSRLEVG
ncbi:hypothetical protein [Candidatus Cyanaurora vandensis]|uniref:hypothetical protein n=1 Tax=Candidatus Cyanaurora vandensis TaxID=2714958 RepID=UPI00257F238E|nr:hypothetical protein [Candidatus Cyanaurora vandensis]